MGTILEKNSICVKERDWAGTWEVGYYPQKRNNTAKKRQSTVSRGFKSERLSDHIGKFVHSSLCLLTWIPNLIQHLLLRVCVKQGLNCLPWLSVGASIAICHLPNKPFIAQKGVPLHIWNIDMPRNEKNPQQTRDYWGNVIRWELGATY